VSGSAITAGLYGLYGNDPKKWNPEVVRQQLVTDFEWKWLIKLLLPHNILLYLLTNYDRSDAMAQVFDDVLFDGKTFEDMSPFGQIEPRIYINSTRFVPIGTTTRHFSANAERPDISPFVFTEEAFEEIGSKLHEYPVSHGVMASGAFPGVFHSVTLTNYRDKTFDGGSTYLHLYDGGPSDNLGILSIVAQLRRTAAAKSCFIFVIDAHNQPDRDFSEFVEWPDMRGLLDLFVDRNAMHATDAMLERLHEQALKEMGLVGKRQVNSTWDIQLRPGTKMTCGVTRLSLDRLYDVEGEKKLGASLNSIRTRYSLRSSRKETPEELQEKLFQAVRTLIWDDKDSARYTCSWFLRHRVSLAGCPNVLEANY
jgi:hypothetical protein